MTATRLARAGTSEFIGSAVAAHLHVGGVTDNREILGRPARLFASGSRRSTSHRMPRSRRRTGD